MEFEKEITEFSDKVLYLNKILISNTNLETDIENLIDAINVKLGDNFFISEFNEKLRDENKDQYLLSLLASLLNYISHLACMINRNGEIEKAFKLIEKISSLKIHEHLIIDAVLITKLLTFLRQNCQILDGGGVILKCVLNLSKGCLFKKVDFSKESKENVIGILNDLEMYSYLKEKQHYLREIKENLNQKSNEEILKSMNLESPIQSFSNELRFISKQLNSDEQFFHWDLFYKYELCKVFTKWLICLIENCGKEDYVMTNERILIDLLEIISKFVGRSLKSNRIFQSEGLFSTFMNLFKNKAVIEIFQEFPAIFIKIMRIFYYLSKSIYFAPSSDQFTEDFNKYRSQFKENLNFFKSLSLSGEESDDNLLFRMYVISLSYLQEKLEPPEVLVDNIYYENFLKSNIIQSFFQKFSDEFCHKCKPCKREFDNELEQIEYGWTYNLVPLSNTLQKNKQLNSIPSYFLADILNNHYVVWSTNIKCSEIRENGYKVNKNFYKSVIFYGFVNEKILAIKILNNFCSSNNLRKEIFDDSELIDYLKIPHNFHYETNYLERLNRMISIFLGNKK